MTYQHKSVLLTQAIYGLAIKSGSWYVDATFGKGGHTREILKRGGKVLALDHDSEAQAVVQTHFNNEIKNGTLLFVRENFRLLKTVVNQNLGNQPIAGVLFDFGTTVDQLTDASKGFSIAADGPLDMRQDDRLGVQAKDLLLLLGEKQLEGIFREFGGEFQARAIAKKIVVERKRNPITTTWQLISLIESIKRGPRGHLHPATKIFQALRIAVNTELENIEIGLNGAFATVQSSGRIVTISFHEGEDRLAKHQFIAWEKQNKGLTITKKPIIPSDEEQQANPRSRSAKLRIFEKL